jgi:serine/threonine protein kinase
LFIRANGTPVIVDLGLARNFARGGTRAVAEADAVAGTYSYMAPEQRTNEIVDARTDLYSLGCILFELLVGHPPPRHDVKPPSQHVEGIPPMLDALVMSQ